MSTQDNVSLDSIFYQELKIKPATQKKLEEHIETINITPDDVEDVISDDDDRWESF